MPHKPKRQCPRPGCPGLWNGTTCTVCGGKPKQDRRLSAAKRGYGRSWQKYREIFLASKYFLCEDCDKHGVKREASVVHHITAVTDRDDPLFWNPDNHMALCRECHEATHDRNKKYGYEN